MPKAAKSPHPAANSAPARPQSLPRTPPTPRNPAPAAPSFLYTDPVLELLSRWPPDQPLAVLHSADPSQSHHHARWSLIARPTVPSAFVPRDSASSAGPCRMFRDLLPQTSGGAITPPPIPTPPLPRSTPLARASGSSSPRSPLASSATSPTTSVVSSNPPPGTRELIAPPSTTAAGPSPTGSESTMP